MGLILVCYEKFRSRRVCNLRVLIVASLVLPRLQCFSKFYSQLWCLFLFLWILFSLHVQPLKLLLLMLTSLFSVCLLQINLRLWCKMLNFACSRRFFILSNVQFLQVEMEKQSLMFHVSQQSRWKPSFIIYLKTRITTSPSRPFIRLATLNKWQCDW